eukprot:gene2572-2971_t
MAAKGKAAWANFKEEMKAKHTNGTNEEESEPEPFVHLGGKRMKNSKEDFKPSSSTNSMVTSAVTVTGKAEKSIIPKSLPVADMLKLGKVVDSKTTVIKVSKFDFASMLWSMIPTTLEFVIDKQSLGEGGFRVAYKATCMTNNPEFESITWVVKKFLPATLEIIAQLKQTPKELAKRIVQGHHLARYFAKQLKEKIESQKLCREFG